MNHDDRAEALFNAVVGVSGRKDRQLPSGKLRLPSQASRSVFPVQVTGGSLEPSDLEFLPDPDFPLDRAALDRGLSKDGVDFLAVYAPYTYWGLDWGIYFFVNRIYDFASAIVEDYPPLGWSASHLLDGLLTMIQEHELLHFRVELASIHHRAATGFDHYSLYHSRHSFSAKGSDAAEEAIATAIELAKGRATFPDVAAAVTALTAQMPKGYRDHAHYRSEAALQKGLRLLSARVLDRDGRGGRVPADVLQEDFARLYAGSVPRYFLVERYMPPWFRDYLLGRQYRQLTLDDIKRHVRRHPGAELVAAGKHQLKVRLAGRSVALQDHPRLNRSYPEHIVRQLADLFGMSKNQYIEAVLAA